MSTLNDWVTVSDNEKPYVNFEESLDVDQVASGYVPVKSTLEVFDFLREAVALSSPRGRAVICHGTYGTGKSRLCTVVARLFRDGPDCPALAPVWGRLRARGNDGALDKLRQSLVPSGRSWRPWLVVPLYADGGGGPLSTALVRGLMKALHRANLSDDVLGKTVFHEAAARLELLISNGKQYQPAPNSRLATPEQMSRALKQDFDEQALQEFRDWHMRETVIDFYDVLRASGGAYQAHELYPLVAERLQRHGYEGIVVLWDEFGLALESLLKGSQAATRDLNLEAMSLQDFVEHACGSTDLGKRVVFLGFTHMSLTEYGQRSGLTDTERNRLETVAARFRDPSIFIKLSVTELEGYHLLAGMLHRTAAGNAVFGEPLPKLQRIASRMPPYRLWQTLSSQVCYDDVVAACYPLHPATAAALLLLSDRIAQVNRTAFYYLQSREGGGVAGALAERALPQVDEAGGEELLRVSDLLPFFDEPLRQREPSLFEQYRQALARLPDASPLEVAVLRTVLALSGIQSAELAPTTDFLSFCLCDAHRGELGAEPLQVALSRLRQAQALWMNEATDVWNFVAERGLHQDLEKDLAQEKQLLPEDKTSGELLRLYASLREELTDRLGDFDLDPAATGVVQRVSIRLFDPTKGEKALAAHNPSVGGTEDHWISAFVYLVAVDSTTELDACRSLADTIATGNVYVVLPAAPLSLGADKAREIIAIRQLLEKRDPQSHAYEVLENKLTRLREDLRNEFAKAFGNEGLRSGTTILKTGQPARGIAVTSWEQLLPSIGRDLAVVFDKQPMVRCGTFNEWQDSSGAQWAKIQNIVGSILEFDEKAELAAEYLNFRDSSQEAAIVDGVLCENGFLSYNESAKEWELIRPTVAVASEALRESLRYLVARSTSEKPFVRLYDKLIEPPFGVPNGVIPILTALVFRSEPARIAIYQKVRRNWERVESDLPAAIVGMAREPESFQTRYSKLSTKQRWVFRVIGNEYGVVVPSGGLSDKAEEACEKVAAILREFAIKLPDAALSLPDLLESERDVLRALRGGVPPQPTLLADQLMRWLQEDVEARQELEDAGTSLTAFPATVRVWRNFTERLNRQVEGARAPVRRQLQNLGSDRAGVIEALKNVGAIAGSENPVLAGIVERLSGAGAGDLVDECVAAVSNKESRQLNQEDYGRASGVLEFIHSLAPRRGNATLLLPDGSRRDLPACVHPEATAAARDALRHLQSAFSLDPDQTAVLVLGALYPTATSEVEKLQAAPASAAEKVQPIPVDNE